MNRRHFNTRTALAGAGWAVGDRLAAEDGRGWRVAVIGHTGRGGYGHGLDVMWMTVPGCVVVGVADADPAGLVEARSRLGGVPGFADYRSMLGEVKPDLVAIAPRHIDQHHAMCLAAVEAGARGIYIEKPFCRTPREADEIKTVCVEKGVKLAVAHRNRHHPVLPVIKQMVAAGEIGATLELRSRGKEDHRGGALDAWVLGTHVFDLAAWLAGPARACTAMLYQDGVPCSADDVRAGDEGVGLVAGNAVHARFEMADGTPLFFDSIQNSGVREAAFGLQVIGTSGVIDFRIDREPLAHLRRGNPQAPGDKSTPWIPVSSGGPGVAEPVPDLARRVAGHQAAAEDLIDAIRTNRSPRCGLEAGAATVEMVCAIFESHRFGGARVEMPLSTRDHPLALMKR
jgi:predicted dehydrogenase